MPDTFTATGPDGKPITVTHAPRVRMVCANCGGTNVVCDAYARWDEELQDWLVENRFDKGSHCHDCDGECRIQTIAIDRSIRRRYRATLTVNVLCTAEIECEVEASSIEQARERAKGQARHFSCADRWKIDDGKDFDWPTLQIETIEAVEEEGADA